MFSQCQQIYYPCFTISCQTTTTVVYYHYNYMYTKGDDPGWRLTTPFV